MKRYDEIKNTITEVLKIKSLEDWRIIHNSSTTPTQEMIDLLSPDNVSTPDFWKVADDLFGVDGVCNQIEGGKSPWKAYSDSIDDCNERNLMLAKQFAIPHYLLEIPYRAKVLEIGPGYGGLKKWIETATTHEYHGIDAVVRIPGIVQCTDEGAMPQSFVDTHKQSFLRVISTNVFQHLSMKQRSKYYQQIGEVIVPGGVFIFNTWAFERRGYSKLYGQWIELPTTSEIIHELYRCGFSMHNISQRFDYVTNFVFVKR